MRPLFWIFLLALSVTFAQAQDSSTILIEGNTEWMSVNRTRSVSVAVSDEVKEGCWKTPSSAKTGVELEFVRSGFSVEEKADTFVLLSAVGYKQAKIDLCIVAYDLSIIISDVDPRIADGHRLFGFGGSETIFRYNGVMSGPAWDMSDRLKEAFSQFAQKALVQHAKEIKTITDALKASENKEAAAFWLNWMNNRQ